MLTPRDPQESDTGKQAGWPRKPHLWGRRTVLWQSRLAHFPPMLAPRFLSILVASKSSKLYRATGNANVVKSNVPPILSGTRPSTLFPHLHLFLLPLLQGPREQGRDGTGQDRMGQHACLAEAWPSSLREQVSPTVKAGHVYSMQGLTDKGPGGSDSDVETKGRL